ncbi:rod shape-determining protein MreC [Mobilisporobacter senegalensis]|uniref:Cell shape-determining protein MreC n=1 Tax=Mobilisporobacter senegalensis TaxID=1329262 RepID=A0A3N1XR78_9FIRM|nr:rod shape-determining protein MreC [Mobilisporobacter senegalensis]ROR29170.1 rod shape-determining protein MreC [Mobilisporobacter senegalensis]
MDFLQSLFFKIFYMSITASYIILAILLIRIMIRRAPKKFSYLLWSVVGFRLVCPVSFSSIFSIFNLNLQLRKTMGNNGETINYISNQMDMMEVPKTITGAASQNEVINSDLLTVPTVNVNPIEMLIYGATLVWIAGIAILLIYSTISYIKLKKRISTAVILKENIYECDNIPTPFVLGVIRPKIYIPFHLCENEISYILMHEQYHIKRMDHIIKPFSFLILSIYWFNPLVWISYYCMNKDMEMSCDEKVLNDIGISVKGDYSQSLLSFAVNRRFPDSNPLAFGEINVKERIKNILDFKKPRLWVSLIIGSVCMLVVVACAANPYEPDKSARTVVSNENPDYINQLYAYRNPYIGNVSANGKILNILGVSERLGNFTIEMETSEKPYILRLNFQEEVTDIDTFDIEMSGYATLLLALIDNADEIQWSYPYTRDESMTRYTVYWNQQNLQVMGIDDIKSYGKSADKIRELMEFIDKELSTISYENKILQQDKYELENLRNLYQLDQKYASYPKVAARVISKETNNWYNTFLIDKGTEDGLAVDMNVLAGNGLVGIITEAGKNYSRVRSIIDDSSNVSGMFLKTSDTCIVTGSLKLIDSGLIQVSHISKDADVKDGYEIVTSNISDKYLQGILIGYISDITVDANNMTKSGYLTPAVNFNRLDTVLIITELKENTEELKEMMK